MVAVLVSMLGLAIMNRIEHLQSHVETLTLQTSVDAMRTAVALAAIGKRVPPAPGSNPVQLLEDRPAGYEGSADSVDIKEVAPGSWWFDEREGVLLYRTRHETAGLPNNLPGRVLLLKIVIEGEDKRRMWLRIESK
ncbi:MAG: hypothetical protein WED00_16900 [Aquisalimonadaceae bacterium]